jgi:hypothetical protein
MAWLRQQDRAGIVDAYRFPGSVRQRFGLEHQALGTAEIAAVESATRQWFRLAARHRKAKLAMPSIIVDDYWHEMVLHTWDYQEFCDSALGRFLHHQPESAMTAADAAANRNATLRATFKLAQEDERIEPTKLPLLFRVDRDLGIEGGRRYLADCGGRGICYGLTGSVCLQHLSGVGKKPGGRWRDIPASPADPGGAALSGGVSGACGGGGCGGS